MRMIACPENSLRILMPDATQITTAKPSESGFKASCWMITESIKGDLSHYTGLKNGNAYFWDRNRARYHRNVKVDDGYVDRALKIAGKKAPAEFYKTLKDLEALQHKVSYVASFSMTRKEVSLLKKAVNLKSHTPFTTANCEEATKKVSAFPRITFLSDGSGKVVTTGSAKVESKLGGVGELENYISYDCYKAFEISVNSELLLKLPAGNLVIDINDKGTVLSAINLDSGKRTFIWGF